MSIPYGATWRRIRAQVLCEEPWCRACGRPATEVDHIMPKRLGGTDDRANLQAVCKPHHSRKTYRERCLQEGKRVRFGADARGRPLDPRHPWNRKGSE